MSRQNEQNIDKRNKFDKKVTKYKKMMLSSKKLCEHVLKYCDIRSLDNDVKMYPYDIN